jgi:hypothetical protein
MKSKAEDGLTDAKRHEFMAKGLILLLIGLFCLGYSSPKKTDAALPFNKIVFHSIGCFESCLSYHLQINANKNMELYVSDAGRLNRENNFKSDTSQMGYFSGSANDSIFEDLIKEIETIELAKLEFDGAKCCDGTITTIIVYYDGKRKFLQSMFPPQKADKLINILYGLCRNSKLTKTAKKFDIEE